MMYTPFYRKLIRLVRDRLDDGFNRIYQEPDDYSLFWWPQSVGIADEMEALVGFTGDEDLRREFDEEVEAIRKALLEMNSSQVTAEVALSMWSTIAAPIRLKRGMVYRRWAPSELGAGPILKDMPLDAFLSHMVSQWLKLSRERVSLERSRKRWAIFALILGVINYFQYLRGAQ
ncbi:MAG: hypothetical protein J0L64_26145 [Acidobacteria bacterium]|nr:hypothetical protein [Acidobacteriota bacterium]